MVTLHKRIIQKQQAETRGAAPRRRDSGVLHCLLRTEGAAGGSLLTALLCALALGFYPLLSCQLHMTDLGCALSTGSTACTRCAVLPLITALTAVGLPITVCSRSRGLGYLALLGMVHVPCTVYLLDDHDSSLTKGSKGKITDRVSRCVAQPEPEQVAVCWHNIKLKFCPTWDKIQSEICYKQKQSYNIFKPFDLLNITLDIVEKLANCTHRYKQHVRSTHASWTDTSALITGLAVTLYGVLWLTLLVTYRAQAEEQKKIARQKSIRLYKSNLQTLPEYDIPSISYPGSK